MVSRWLAFVVWAVAACTAAAWLLNLLSAGRPVPAHAVAVDTTASPRGDLTRLLGAAPPVVETPVSAVRADARFTLVGLVAAPSPAAVGKSVAVIAVDGRPARAYRVGAAVDDQTVVLAVRARAVDLGPRGGPLTTTLELAPLAAATTGSLPPPSGAPGAAPGHLAGQMPGHLAGQMQGRPPGDHGGGPVSDGGGGQMLTPQPVPQADQGQNPTGPRTD